MEKLDARKLSDAAINDLRHRAIRLYKKGHNMREVADLLSVSCPAVQKWVKLFKTEGMKGLKTKQRGRPKGNRKLTPEIEKKIIKAMIDKTSDQLKLPFGLWTREAVRHLLAEKYGTFRSLPQIGQYRKTWGFTLQKPIYKAYEQKEERVEQWLEEEYPALKAEAREDSAVIYWGDEMGMHSDHAAGRTYALKGKTPVIKRTGKRYSINMISVITNEGHKEFQLFKGSFNSERFIWFFQQLIKYKRHKVFLVVDRYLAHKTKKVQAWVSEHSERIKLIILPPYSPELNPDAYLNQDLKTNAVGKHRTNNADEMIDLVTKFQATRCKRIIMNYFKHPKIAYAA